jgi:hypothetical protein
MINITIEEIFDRLFNELKTEYKSIEPKKEIFNGMEIIIPQEIIKKKNLKFIRYIKRNITEYSILANEEVMFSGVYSSAVKEEHNYEEARLLNELWKKLEESFELRKIENISNKYEKIRKALTGE